MDWYLLSEPTHDFMAKTIEIRASEVISKTPNFYTYELIGGVADQRLFMA